MGLCLLSNSHFLPTATGPPGGKCANVKHLFLSLLLKGIINAGPQAGIEKKTNLVSQSPGKLTGEGHCQEGKISQIPSDRRSKRYASLYYFLLWKKKTNPPGHFEGVCGQKGRERPLLVKLGRRPEGRLQVCSLHLDPR